MKILFRVRFTESKDKDVDWESLGVKRPKDSFVYEDLVQDSSNIIAFNGYDDSHTCLRTALGEVFIVKGAPAFIARRWSEITGEKIYECTTD